MKIHVTQKHIDRGIRYRSDHCPLAIAINEQCPAYEAFVAGGDVGVNLYPLLEHLPAENVKLAASARLFVIAFDASMQLKPFSFNLDIPKRDQSPRVAAPPAPVLQEKEEEALV